MLKRFALGLSTAVLASVALTSIASAHTPHDVRHKLQDRGYYNINFTDRVLPTYQLNACKRHKRFHLHVNYYGEVTRRRRIGWCGRHRSHVRKRYVY